MPIDGSDCSYRALSFAVAMADRYAAAIDVVHVTDEHTPRTDDVVARARTVLETAGRDGDVEVRTDLDRGYRPAEAVAETILALVAERGYDHVVMGHHGDDAMVRAVLGSTAEAVVDARRVPTTVVP
ncbi:MAG: universal stress protein [Halanaeroarchaeum sp.]